MTERINYMKSKKYLYLAALIALVIYLYYNNTLFENAILDNMVRLEVMYSQSPLLLLSYIFLYIFLTTMLPVALLLGLLSGFIFELYVAIIIISLRRQGNYSYVVFRYFISDYVSRRFEDEISQINNGINLHGAYYLFALRMSPIFPFFVINVAFGLTKIKTAIFYLISQLGMLPGTIIIVLIGSELNSFLIEGSPFSIDLVVYLTLLGLIPLAFKKYMKF